MQFKYAVLGSAQVYKETIEEDTDISVLSLSLAGDKYAIAVDPSTSSSGIIIGNVETKDAEYLIALERDRKSGKEDDHTVYNRTCYNLFNKWVEENKEKLLAIKVEQPFKDKKQTQENYAKQMASFNVFTSIARRHGINCIVTTATKWRSLFLADYKVKLGLDLRKANKDVVHAIATGMQIEMTSLPNDVSDAYGLWCHYLATDYSDGRVIMAPGDNHREKNHQIRCIVSSQENVAGYITSYMEEIHKYHPTAKKVEFEFNPKLSAEENIRCFTSATSDQKYNLYYCALYPSINIIREVVKFKKYIGRIHKNTPLYVVGYRIN